MTLRERLIGALNMNPGISQSSIDGTVRYIHARVSEVADAVLEFMRLAAIPPVPELESKQFSAQHRAELVSEADRWLEDFGQGYQDFPGDKHHPYEGKDLIQSLRDVIQADFE